MIKFLRQLNVQQRKFVFGIGLGMIGTIILIISIVGIVSGGQNTSHTDHASELLSETESENMTESGKPSESEQLTETEKPSESERPTENEKTSESQQPTESEKPIESEQPTESEKPSESQQPTESEDPTESESLPELVEMAYGIDVSKYQGTIDWKQVAETGIDFVMVRVGYRTMIDGEIVEDKTAKYNMQEASKYGIKVGVYFFSTAITKEEAIAEADWVANMISRYSITYPVVYNCEGFDKTESRQNSLTKTQRTDYAIAFMNRIAEHGYAPMFYANVKELEDEAKWETSRIKGNYRLWVAYYPDKPYPETMQSNYSKEHDMWQYTNKGNVPGINASVDRNIAYFDIDTIAEPKDPVPPEVSKPEYEIKTQFVEVDELVTAKDKVNLRTLPSIEHEDCEIVAPLYHGEIIKRTGINEELGWSRVEYNGQILYCISSYLELAEEIEEETVR